LSPGLLLYCWRSSALGAAQPASSRPSNVRSGPETSRRVLRLLIVSPASLYVCVADEPAIGAGHEARYAPIAAVQRSLFHPRRFASFAAPSGERTDLAPSFAPGDGHEVEALADVRSTDARSAQIRCPEGVTRSFQVSANKVEPPEAVRARNLLSKHDWRSALGDELEPVGPEVAVVAEALGASGAGEGLAGTGACPNRESVRPSGGSEGMRPDADAGEEVGLRVDSDVIGCQVSDAAFFDVAERHVAAGN
jgi:hypothetical protein